MTDIRIIPTTDAHVEGFHQCVDMVARERRYLGFVEGPPLAQSRAFVEMLLAGGGVHFVAVDSNETVVGWCDIVRVGLAGFTHTGRLGMGLVPAAREQGHGSTLAQVAIAAAVAQGMERIELEVFASNTRAIRLYERLGFVTEGVKRDARKLDGVYDDNVLMAWRDVPVGR